MAEKLSESAPEFCSFQIRPQSVGVRPLAYLPLFYSYTAAFLQLFTGRSWDCREKRMTLRRHLWDRARINRGGQEFFVFCLSVWLFSPPLSIQWLQKQSYQNWHKVWPLQHTEEVPHSIFTDTTQFLVWTYVSCISHFNPHLSVTHIASDHVRQAEPPLLRVQHQKTF